MPHNGWAGTAKVCDMGAKSNKKQTQVTKADRQKLKMHKTKMHKTEVQTAKCKGQRANSRGRCKTTLAKSAKGKMPHNGWAGTAKVCDMGAKPNKKQTQVTKNLPRWTAKLPLQVKTACLCSSAQVGQGGALEAREEGPLSTKQCGDGGPSKKTVCGNLERPQGTKCGPTWR